jgi:hypothetical protein
MVGAVLETADLGRVSTCLSTFHPPLTESLMILLWAIARLIFLLADRKHKEAVGRA